jgi:hypothetical protein
MSYLNKKKKPILLFTFTAVLIAGLLDIKYKGLFYQMLPGAMQEEADKLFQE